MYVYFGMGLANSRQLCKTNLDSRGHLIGPGGNYLHNPRFLSHPRLGRSTFQSLLSGRLVMSDRHLLYEAIITACILPLFAVSSSCKLHFSLVSWALHFIHVSLLTTSWTIPNQVPVGRCGQTHHRFAGLI